MRRPVSAVWAACAVATLVACGGEAKPPMVPDSPDPSLIGGDGGPADLPTLTAPAPAAPPTK